ncbi:DUF389 domain-containing protein [Candidatus Nomurabacteria bacterium]|nr:DUF389 domain-containing protein [Candidatus Nomurabacteria bacterium]USN94920.1 MAG: DUF389 domain-containing protein [Candidatus Nomurabacteria bacterium]
MEENKKFFSLTKGVTDQEIRDSLSLLIKNSSPKQEFFVLVVASVMLATFAIMLDNIPVLIASMLVAPILYPILTISLGVVINDPVIMSSSIKMVIRSVVFALILSTIVAFLFGRQGVSEQNFIFFSSDLFLSFLTATVSGLIASYGIAHPRIGGAMPGVAIAVSLIPPLAGIGVGIASLELLLVRDALATFIVNIIGIVGSAIFVFSLFQFQRHHREIRNMHKKEAAQPDTINI